MIGQKTKEELKRYLEVIVYLSLYLTIIFGVFMFSFMLFHLTVMQILEYFIILGILIIVIIYLNR
jgi:hypothetical protein